MARKQSAALTSGAVLHQAVTSIDNLKVELDQPPFVDKLMYDMRNQMSAPRRGLGGSSFRSTASARPGGSIDVKSPASLGRLNSHRSNISAGAKEAAKAQRPRTADPTAVP